MNRFQKMVVHVGDDVALQYVYANNDMFLTLLSYV